MLLLLSLISQCSVVTSNSCQNDRNKDHRLRVSCVAQGLSAVPNGIDLNTEVLVFTQNQFTSLSWAAYSAFAHLHELDLSKNHISIIDPPGRVLGHLRVLRLSNNRLVGLGGRVFTSTPNLTEVYLDGNTLRSLHDSTFSDLPCLEVINLSGNQLPALPRQLLERVSSSSLKTFDLEDNQVQIMPNGFFSSKPDLPYVFLSLNPWQCTCEVGYLQVYLEDQEHNVYRHTEATALENSPESVVCAGPQHLKGQAILNLREDEYCSSDMPTHTADTPMAIITDKVTGKDTTTSMDMPVWPLNLPGGDMDFWHTSSVIHSTTSTPIQITSTATTTTDPGFTTSLTGANPGNVMPSMTVPPVPPRTPLPASTLLYRAFYNWTEIESWTIKYNWSESWTFKWNSSLQQHPTVSTDRERSDVPSSHTERLGRERLPVPSTHATFATHTTHATVRLPPGASGSRHGQRLLPWCWWLVAGLLPLCVISGLCCCMLLLWLFLTYSALYRPLQAQASSAGLCGGVTLKAFRPTDGPAGTGGAEGNGQAQRVVFLPPEKIRETQAVFRSMLFISKGDGEDERTEGEKVNFKGETQGHYVTSKTEQRPLVEQDGMEGSLQGDGSQVSGSRGTDRKEVFRKTLYRVISREEEIEGWREMESWGLVEEKQGIREGEVERGKTRYSLILREQRGSGMEDMRRGMEWLVGEWEMGAGQLNDGRRGNLITNMENEVSPATSPTQPHTHTPTPEGV